MERKKMVSQWEKVCHIQNFLILASSLALKVDTPSFQGHCSSLIKLRRGVCNVTDKDKGLTADAARHSFATLCA